MSSIKDISSSTKVHPDLAKKIKTDGVNEILNILWKGYHAVKSDTSIKIDVSTEEDDITQKWAEKIQQIWDSRNRATTLAINELIPMHQYADNTIKKRKGSKSPTIDFCFKDWTTDNSYFGAEAKNLYQGKPDKIKRYVSTGVKNYIDGRYGSQSSESSIVGYVLSGNISTLVKELKKEIRKESHIYNLTRTTTIVEPQYHSRHVRSFDSREIILHHLFFNFVTP